MILPFQFIFFVCQAKTLSFGNICVHTYNGDIHSPFSLHNSTVNVLETALTASGIMLKAKLLTAGVFHSILCKIFALN